MNYQNKSIITLQLNCNGIVRFAKRLELDKLLKIHSPDIVFLCETHTKLKHKIQFNNYTSIRNDRTNSIKGGGTAILVKKNIKFEILDVQNLNSLFNSTIIKIFSYQTPIIAASIYCNKILNPSDITIISNLGDKVIIAGDYNAKSPNWYCNTYNRNGLILENYLDNNSNLTLNHPNTSTRISSNILQSDSIIDLMITKNIQYIKPPITTDTFSSDHLPIIASISFLPFFELVPIKVIRNYTLANWISFKQKLNLSINHQIQIISIDTLEIAVENLTSSIQQSINTEIPLVKIKPYKISKTVSDLIDRKKNLIKIWRHHRLPFIKTEINYLSKTISKQIFLEYNDLFTKRLEKCNNNLRNIHKVIKSHSSSKILLPPFLQNGHTINNPKTKVEIIAKYFYNIHNSIDHRQQTNNPTKDIDAFLKAYQPLPNTTHTSPKKLKNIIKFLPNNRAPGHDGIPNIVLKNLTNKALILLTKIVNACFNLGHFPTKWKLAKVFPIPKPGKKLEDPSNYRPISLLSCIAKVVEKVLLNKINEYIEQKNIIPNFQFGFRLDHSTTDALIRFNEHLAIAKNKKYHTIAIFLDIEKAFDTVWHDKLIQKLTLLKFQPNVIKLIHSYLKDRQFYVKIDSDKSNEYTINAGVPQGSLLSPTLYNIYTHDIPVDPNTNMSIYADDTAIYASGANPKCVSRRIQTHLDRLSQYFIDNKIKINHDKSSYIIFTNKLKFGKKTNPIAMSLNNCPLIKQKEITYLGLTYTSKLSWNKHFDKLNKKTLGTICKLKHFLNNNSPINTKNKLNIYKLYIRPLNTYAMPAIFNSINKKCLNKISVMERKCLRRAINFKFSNYMFPKYISNTNLYKKCELKTIINFIIEKSIIALKKTKHSQNPYLNGLGKFKKKEYKYMKHKPPHFILTMNPM